MNDLASLIDNLRQAGIQPQVAIVVDPNNTDVQAIKTLQTSLKNAGIIAQVQINLSPSAVTQPTANPQDTSAPAGQDRRVVRVTVPRLNCFAFRTMDKAGKPDMFIREPRVQLPQGTKFSVSTSHKAGLKDAGDGTTFGTGNIEYFFVVDCPANSAAVGLYVRKVDVEDSV